MTPEEYRRHDATGLAGLIRNREVSPAEVFAAFLSRVATANPTLNAVVLPDFDAAHAAVRAGLPDGPFRGVPYLIKDLHAPVAGLPLSHGSRLFAGSVNSFDSTTVGRLRAAGFVIAGRTNAPEFGMNVTTEPNLHGPARNPWSIGHSTGGSSGGAAAAVAGGILPASHATDSAGSIRIPAGCCGLVGLKPTRGRNAVGPHRGDAMMGLSHEHCVSRSVRDCAAILDATAGPDEGAPWFTAPPPIPFAAEVGRDPGRLRICVVTRSWTGATVHPDCVAAVEQVGRACGALGHDVGPVALDVDGAGLIDAINTILLSGLAGIVRQRERELGRPAGDDIEPFTAACVAAWEGTSEIALHAANARINAIVRATARQMRDLDVLLTPMLSRPPARLGELRTDLEDAALGLRQLWDYAAFTPLFSATGQPAMNLPICRNAEGLPIGVQAVAKFGNDAVLLRLAAQLEPGFISPPASI
jgi:Asp-tRNA(Asn)/Glu-tRNA(Gln) amidotransferase A subunit family amidase